MITYWIRVGCGWKKVTTQYETYLRLPHVSATGACKLTAFALAAVLTSSNAAPKRDAGLAPPQDVAAPPIASRTGDGGSAVGKRRLGIQCIFRESIQRCRESAVSIEPIQ